MPLGTSCKGARQHLPPASPLVALTNTLFVAPAPFHLPHRKAEGPALLEARVRPGARKNLGRPTTTTLQNKSDFMAFLDY